MVVELTVVLQGQHEVVEIVGVTVQDVLIELPAVRVALGGEPAQLDAGGVARWAVRIHGSGGPYPGSYDEQDGGREGGQTCVGASHGDRLWMVRSTRGW